MTIYLQEKAINNILENDIAKVVKETERDKANEHIYSQPTSGLYHRRGNSGGGIGDINNMESYLSKSGELVVENTTSVNPLTKPDGSFYRSAFPKNYNLAEIIEFGNENGIIHNKPRKFITATVDELKNSNKISNTMRKALKRRGIQTD